MARPIAIALALGALRAMAGGLTYLLQDTAGGTGSEHWGSYTLDAGAMTIFDVEPSGTTDQVLMGIDSDATGDPVAPYIELTTGGKIECGGAEVDTYTAARIKLAMVRSAGLHFFLRQDLVSEAWSLLWVDETAPQASGYVAITDASSVLTRHEIAALNLDVNGYSDWATDSGVALVYDSCTDTDGTRPGDHTPDVGAAWSTAGHAATSIQANRMATTGSGFLLEQVTQAMGSADFLAFAGFYGDRGGTIGRFTDADNHWFTVRHSGGTCRLIERTGGGQVARGSVAYVPSSGDRFAMICRGTSLTVFFDDTNSTRLSYASSSHQSVQAAGVRMLAEYGSHTIHDDIAIYPATVTAHLPTDWS